MPRLICFVPRTAWVVAALLVVCSPAFAQDTITQEAPAHISLVEGTAVLERAGETDSSPTSMPLLAGDRVRTRAGRVEILFPDGSTLHLDANTVVDFQSDEVIRLLEGRIRLNIVGPDRPIAYRVDAPSGWVEVKQPGEYRLALVGGERGREVELAVLRGAADLVNEDGVTELRAGERAFAAVGAAPSRPYVFNSAAWDAFDRWSEERRAMRLGISAQYLPSETRPYAATLDSYGSWRHEPTYGYVWYPRVAAGWRPYYHGRWSHFRPFGWTWIGHDPWAWPTHHYGRWGFSAGLWFWIPGRHWGPAWVSWAYAPGYVSWCPLGFNNRPVFSFVNVNVFGGHRFDRWRGWTVVPHRRFGSGFVNVNVVNVTRIDSRTRGAFAVRNVAPEFRGRATPRASAPIRVAGYAVPRNGSAGIGSSSATPGARTRESFRQRGSAGERLNGPGFPAPAREARPSAVPRIGERARSATSRERTSSSASAPQVERGRAAPRAVPRTSEPSATPSPERRTPAGRVAPRGAQPPAAPARGSGSGTAAAPNSGRSRAVPRTSEPSAAPAPSRGTPSRRVAPRGGGGSAASGPARGSEQTASPAPSPERSRAVPRRRDSSAPAPSAVRSYGRAPGAAAPSSPARSYRAPATPGRSGSTGSPNRTIRRAPEQPAYQGPRSGSRSASPAPPSRVYGPGPRSGRSAGVARPASSAPARGPSQRSASPAPGPSRGSSAAAPSSRSRGGQPSGGTARRRGGGIN